MNKKLFYDTIRKDLFSNKLSASQVQGIEAILVEYETKYSMEILPSGVKNKNYVTPAMLAYILATPHHECDGKFQPIEEYGKGAKKDYGKLFIDKNKKQYGKTMGQGGGKRGVYYAPLPLQVYYGRGFVQLTWYENYEKAAKKLSIDCLKRPELVMELSNAANILFMGMIEGWFTSQKLSHHFTATKTDWFNARRIINGTDKAELIAGYAKKYYNALLVAMK